MQAAKFQSTSPARGMTGTGDLPLADAWISIHIPRTGDDNDLKAVDSAIRISIHIPRTGDDQIQAHNSSADQISIHIPRTGDDPLIGCADLGIGISIHIPRTGDDVEESEK